MTFENISIHLLKKAIRTLEDGFDLPPVSERGPTQEMEDIMEATAKKMQDNYPYFHPLFAGQMLKPPHPVAKAAYMLAMWVNPNNHALDGGRASSEMEKEAVSDLANMFGMPSHLGHLTGGGTMANLEALWVGGQIHPGKMVVASDQAHYTHERISGVLKVGFKKVATDEKGVMDVGALEDLCKKKRVGTVVCTMGTTGTGSVDPLDEIVDLQNNYGFRIHADAAYGGYFALLDNLSLSTAKKYGCLDHVDSIVIDPHKHGLQPYGCGCVLFKDPGVAQYYRHHSPYTYFTSDALHLGEISLECSRPGAAAVGLWATHQLLPPVRQGRFAHELGKSRNAAKNLFQKVKESDRFAPVMEPETDIVAWSIKGKTTKEMSEKAHEAFERAESNQLYLSLYQYPTRKLKKGPFIVDTDYITCLRSCLMKPEHDAWLDEIWERLGRSMGC